MESENSIKPEKIVVQKNDKENIANEPIKEDIKNNEQVGFSIFKSEEKDIELLKNSKKYLEEFKKLDKINGEVQKINIENQDKIDKTLEKLKETKKIMLTNARKIEVKKIIEKVEKIIEKIEDLETMDIEDINSEYIRDIVGNLKIYRLYVEKR